jgi:hypothetical protein
MLRTLQNVALWVVTTIGKDVPAGGAGNMKLNTRNEE